MYFRRLLSLSCLLTSWALRNSCSAGFQPHGCLIVTSAHFCIPADKNIHCMLGIVLLSQSRPPEVSPDSSSSLWSCTEMNELHREDKPESWGWTLVFSSGCCHVSSAFSSKRHFDHYPILRKVHEKSLQNVFLFHLSCTIKLVLFCVMVVYSETPSANFHF